MKDIKEAMKNIADAYYEDEVSEEESIRADERAKVLDEIIDILKHRNTTIMENGYEYHGYDDEELDEIAEELKE